MSSSPEKRADSLEGSNQPDGTDPGLELSIQEGFPTFSKTFGSTSPRGTRSSSHSSPTTPIDFMLGRRASRDASDETNTIPSDGTSQLRSISLDFGPSPRTSARSPHKAPRSLLSDIEDSTVPIPPALDQGNRPSDTYMASTDGSGNGNGNGNGNTGSGSGTGNWFSSFVSRAKTAVVGEDGSLNEPTKEEREGDVRRRALEKAKREEERVRRALEQQREDREKEKANAVEYMEDEMAMLHDITKDIYESLNPFKLVEHAVADDIHRDVSPSTNALGMNPNEQVMIKLKEHLQQPILLADDEWKFSGLRSLSSRVKSGSEDISNTTKAVDSTAVKGNSREPLSTDDALTLLKKTFGISGNLDGFVPTLTESGPSTCTVDSTDKSSPSSSASSSTASTTTSSTLSTSISANSSPSSPSSAGDLPPNPTTTNTFLTPLPSRHQLGLRYRCGSDRADYVLWQLRLIANLMSSPNGGHLTPNLHVPAELWYALPPINVQTTFNSSFD